MNLHQFKFVQEAVRRNLNLTEAAKALHTSQPGVSKAIIELEDELGIEIFARHGKRIKRVTEPGQQVLKSIDIILREVNNLRRIGEQRVIEREHQHVLPFIGGQGHQLGVVHQRLGGHADLGHLFDEHARHLVGRALVQADADLGVGLAQRGHRAGQHVARLRVGGGD